MIKNPWYKRNYKKHLKNFRNYYYKNRKKLREKYKIWYLNNRESQIQRSKDYQSKNGRHKKTKEESRRDAKNWYCRNPELARSRARQWVKRNKDKVRNAAKKYRKNNPNWVKQWKQLSLAKKKYPGLIDIKVIRKVYKRNKTKFGRLTCYICEKRLTMKTASLEHIKSLKENGTNHIDNLDIAHMLCNNKKRQRNIKIYKLCQK